MECGKPVLYGVLIECGGEVIYKNDILHGNPKLKEMG